MKVLMLGWEFPPYSKGGLGTACYGLTKGLKNNDVDVTFVMPKAPNNAKSHVKVLGANNYELEFPDGFYTDIKGIKCYKIDSLLVPYITPEEYKTNYEAYKYKYAKLKKKSSNETDDDLYGHDLHSEVHRFAHKASLIAKENDFDVIHAHDWMTYPAALAVKHATGKPLVVHIHATDYDRSGGNGCNGYIYDIEREGFMQADKILAVSNFTKSRVVNHYGIDPGKVDVVHNAVDFNGAKFSKSELKSNNDEKIVLFLGRITLQKGPEYFLYSAKQVLDHSPDKNIKFVFAGSGDMESRMIQLAAELGISKNVLFTGWVKGPEVDKLYSMADLYVMPSVSEPFGITPLESIRNGTPALISYQSGVSEVLSHALKVDFWDVDEMTNKMMAVLNYSPLHKTLVENGATEVLKFSWDEPASKCVKAYNEVIDMRSF